MSKLIVCKDLHVRSNKPYYLAQTDFIEWLGNQDWNNENNSILFLGDLFHEANPDSLSNSLVLDLFENKIKTKKSYILCGNNAHEYNSIKKSHAIDILSPLNKNIELIFKPSILEISNIKCLILPFINKKEFIPVEYKSMREYYENLPDEFKSIKYDFLFSHIEDETIQFSKTHKGINLSYLNITERIQGHIHNAKPNYNLGMPVLSRYDEKDEKPQILIIDTQSKEKTYIDVPEFIQFYDIEYNVDLLDKKFNSKYKIFTIKECININSAKEMYNEKYKKQIENNEFYFRKFELKKEKIDNENLLNVQVKNNLSLKNFLNDFFEINKISNKVRERINNKI